ncbi:hypothetical protein [Nocardia sp. NBC_00403]|uniref:hypothetical protein n=1 Tax=Nocardia sp. NBC_00403 TaxID=2975990 RepID=UPI002E2229FF
MFDDDLAQSLVDRATTFQRALVATSCLNRAVALTHDEWTDREVPGFRQLIDDSTEFCRARAVGGPPRTDPDLLNARFREILGPDDWPCDEPDGLAAWLIDVVSIADYVIRTWNEPDLSDSRCFNVLVASYSLAGMLNDDAVQTGARELGELEVTRQIADLRAVTSLHNPIGVDQLDWLLAESDALAEAYRRRFQDIVAEYGSER